jgi:hypothetical protein
MVNLLSKKSDFLHKKKIYFNEQKSVKAVEVYHIWGVVKLGSFKIQSFPIGHNTKLNLFQH